MDQTTGAGHTDFDFLGDSSVIQVFGGRGTRKTVQIATIFHEAGARGIPHIAVCAPDAGKFVTRGIEQQGVPVLRTFDRLVDWVRNST